MIMFFKIVVIYCFDILFLVFLPRGARGPNPWGRRAGTPQNLTTTNGIPARRPHGLGPRAPPGTKKTNKQNKNIKKNN